MAEPVITVTLLTPISLRLSWTGGNGDYEVWWKSDHPASQEYAKLAFVTGTSYDVGSLSWTTTYYFKVKNSAGEWSDEIHLFVCCGQAVLYGNPPGEGVPPTITKDLYWQQCVDIDGDTVAFVPENKPPGPAPGNTSTTAAIFLYDIPTDTWTFKGNITAEAFKDYNPINLSRDKITMIASTAYTVVLGIWNGSSYRMESFPVPAGSDFMMDGQANVFNHDGRIVATVYVARDLSLDMTNRVFDETDPNFSVYSFDLNFNISGPKTIDIYLNDSLWGSYNVTENDTSLHVNVSPLSYYTVYTIRVYMHSVIGPSSWSYIYRLQPWPGFSNDTPLSYYTGYEAKMYVYVSYDNGGNFSGPTLLFEGYGYDYMDMDEDEDGNIWFIVMSNKELVAASIEYKIYKYVVGSPVELIRTIDTDTSTYYGDSCKIAVNGDIIVALYGYKIPGQEWVEDPLYEPTELRLSISTDGGANWSDITFNPGFPAGYYQLSDMSFGLCVSGTNILVYTWSGTDYIETDPLPQVKGYNLFLSTDYGATWSSVIDFVGYDLEVLSQYLGTYPWLRTDGDKVVLSTCDLSATGASTPLGFFLSENNGVTWRFIEIDFAGIPQIMVPA